MLRMAGERTGYEIKAMVDDSTEFFWPASYGRIYPELRRLEEEGLIEGREEPRGDRPRKLYALTPEGEEALEQWLTSRDEPIFELRDEGFLKFFFADAIPRERAIENLRAMGARHERIAARLRELEPCARPSRSSSRSSRSRAGSLCTGSTRSGARLWRSGSAALGRSRASGPRRLGRGTGLTERAPR